MGVEVKPHEIVAVLHELQSERDEVRMPAEAKLDQWQSAPGFLLSLVLLARPDAARTLSEQLKDHAASIEAAVLRAGIVHVGAGTSDADVISALINPSVRLLAAIVAKNTASRPWYYNMDKGEKAQVRAALLGIVGAEPVSSIITQIALVIGKMARSDVLKAEWPELFPALVRGAIASDLHTSLQSLLVLKETLREVVLKSTRSSRNELVASQVKAPALVETILERVLEPGLAEVMELSRNITHEDALRNHPVYMRFILAFKCVRLIFSNLTLDLMTVESIPRRFFSFLSRPECAYEFDPDDEEAAVSAVESQQQSHHFHADQLRHGGTMRFLMHALSVNAARSLVHIQRRHPMEMLGFLPPFITAYAGVLGRMGSRPRRSVKYCRLGATLLRNILTCQSYYNLRLYSVNGIGNGNESDGDAQDNEWGLPVLASGEDPSHEQHPRRHEQDPQGEEVVVQDDDILEEIDEHLEEHLKHDMYMNALMLIRALFVRLDGWLFCEQVAASVFVLQPEELEEWADDPESFRRDEDAAEYEPDKHLRPVCEAMLMALMERNPFVKRKLLGLLERCASESRQTWDAMLFPEQAAAAGFVADPSAFLRYEACLRIVGKAYAIWHDKVPLKEILDEKFSILIPAANVSLNADGHFALPVQVRALLARSVWFIGMFSESVRPPVDHITVYKLLVHFLLPKNGDLVISIATCQTLHYIADSLSFVPDEFVPMLQPAVERAYNLIDDCQEFDTVRQILDLVSLLFMKCPPPASVSMLELVARHVPRLIASTINIHASADARDGGRQTLPSTTSLLLSNTGRNSFTDRSVDDQTLMANCVLAQLRYVVDGVGEMFYTNRVVCELVFEMIRYTIRSNEDTFGTSYSLLDGLELWHCTVSVSSEYRPELHAMLDALTYVSDRTEHLSIILRLIESYVILGGEHLLAQKSGFFCELLLPLFHEVRPRAVLLLLETLDWMLLVDQAAGFQHAFPLLPEVYAQALGSIDDAYVSAVSLVTLCRLLVQRNDLWQQLVRTVSDIRTAEQYTDLMFFFAVRVFDLFDEMHTTPRQKVATLALCEILKQNCADRRSFAALPRFVLLALGLHQEMNIEEDSQRSLSAEDGAAVAIAGAGGGAGAGAGSSGARELSFADDACDAYEAADFIDLRGSLHYERHPGARRHAQLKQADVLVQLDATAVLHEIASTVRALCQSDMTLVQTAARELPEEQQRQLLTILGTTTP
ncbi:Importin-11 [Porphyridium purpureum]|uniref:Importin-11 n=1 Tax=Porphyridium purpureum TaxID=35688 RepID=A0A5J4Z2Y0_PORPP|nr:Importin-11 [Porphyridium purpureum]|eukprot:POR4245..scf295_1